MKSDPFAGPTLSTPTPPPAPMPAVRPSGTVGLRLGLSLAALAFFGLTGAKEGGCGTERGSNTPDVSGDWAVAYDDTLEVELTIGGATYQETLGAEGGAITIDHDGLPFTFELDCERPEVLCPSEVWPDEIGMVNKKLKGAVEITLPKQICDGELEPADPDTCGEGTRNPDCSEVCTGEVSVEEAKVPGVINHDGTVLDVLLGAGLASNGINCALLGISAAKADLITEGSSDQGDWSGVALEDGKVTVAYTGGCLWAGDPDGDDDLDALVLGASLVFRTGFVADRLN